MAEIPFSHAEVNVLQSGVVAQDCTLQIYEETKVRSVTHKRGYDGSPYLLVLRNVGEDIIHLQPFMTHVIQETMNEDNTRVMQRKLVIIRSYDIQKAEWRRKRVASGFSMELLITPTDWNEPIFCIRVDNRGHKYRFLNKEKD